jgi:DNA-directed RNA polymerase subunit D
MMDAGRREAVEGNGSKVTGMKVQIETLKSKYAEIDIENAPLYLLNAIRRIMLSELPKLAINDVVIYDNTTALFDEIIAHRLGLVPIPTDLTLLNFRDQCSCNGVGCPSCTVRYTLSKEGSGTVHSGDLQPAEASWTITEDKIPIVDLFGDQRLILEVEAVLGRGKNHAKWQPVISPGYRLHPTISFKSEHKAEVEEFISDLPNGLVTLKGNELVLSDIKQLPVLESYIDRQDMDLISIDKDPSHIHFHFETDGALYAKDAMIHAIKLFEEKLLELKEHIEQL